MELASGTQLKILHEQFQAVEFDPAAKIRSVMEIYDQLNIRTITENIAREYISKSADRLEKVSVGHERKKELKSLVNSLIGRIK
jgi:geranylgeranyl pyrophosphate synthase